MTTCSACGAQATPGLRWCGICHANLLNAQIGRLASPARRLGAHFLDIAIPATAVFGVAGVVGVGAASAGETGAGVGVLLGFGLVVGYAIWALVLFSSGTTPGKNMLGMRVVKESGTNAGFLTMLVREWIGKLISGMLLSLGFLWILIDRDRQGWHDKLMTTYVVEGAGAGAAPQSPSL